MSAKLSILDELSNILTQKEKADEGVSRFFKTVQNGAVIEVVFGSKKAGLLTDANPCGGM